MCISTFPSNNFPAISHFRLRACNTWRHWMAFPERLPQSEPNWEVATKRTQLSSSSKDGIGQREEALSRSWIVLVSRSAGMFRSICATYFNFNEHSLENTLSPFILRNDQNFSIIFDLAIFKNQSNKQGMKAHHCALWQCHLNSSAHGLGNF